MYTVYMAGCSVDSSTNSASSLKQDFSSACGTGSSSAGAIMNAVSASDCSTARNELKTVTSISTKTPVDAEMLATASKLAELETYLVEGNVDLQGLKTLGSLESLTILGSSVQSLNGIQGLSKLKNVSILSTSLKSIDISGPNKIKSLWIDSEVLENISNLSSFQELEALYIFTNKTIDLSAIKNLPKLKTLWIKSEGALNLAPLREIPALTDLMVYNDSIAQMVAFDGIKPLESLTIKSSALQNINGISSSSYGKTLKSLQLVGTAVTDLSEVSNIATLNGLATVDGQNVKVPFSALKGRLTSLNTSGTTLDLSTADLTGFKKLTSLSIDMSNLPLAQLDAPGLSYLTTNQTPRAGSDFQNFASLQHLGAQNAGLTNITGLANKPKLAFLDIKQNAVGNFAELEKSQDLQYLDMSYNGVKDGFDLPRLAKVETILANHNDFTQVKLFKRQPELLELDLSYTKTDASSISNLFVSDEVGEDRSLWLSVVRCQGIALAQDRPTCNINSNKVPTADTITLLQYKATFLGQTLESERKHIEALENLKINTTTVNAPACTWIHNHIELINNLYSVVTAEKDFIASNTDWKEPNADELLKGICGDRTCSQAELAQHYTIDINACLSGAADPVTLKILSQNIMTKDELEKKDKEAGYEAGYAVTLDYVTSADQDSHVFLIYLQNLEISLSKIASSQSSAVVNLDTAIQGARKVLETSLAEANSYMAKVKRIEATLRTRIGTLREQLDKMIKGTN
ncbi:MAG TPA: hypothetical protein VE954_18440 [Oligoflexus sp.]|uniref:hypothetical protein n=1 Tax=Oligoflexus sp. TaxID=1971216 RepID=UPI002D271244|nr:hypothetical protein [Oligoflexus sp.]HYX35081.1 hypothetical protein [Oligoflexus sp.]